MTANMKYVICDNQNIAIFSDVNTHADIAKGMYGKVTGAGFIFFKDNKPICHGQSVSLKVKSNEEFDSYIIQKSLN